MNPGERDKNPPKFPPAPMPLPFGGEAGSERGDDDKSNGNCGGGMIVGPDDPIFHQQRRKLPSKKRPPGSKFDPIAPFNPEGDEIPTDLPVIDPINPLMDPFK